MALQASLFPGRFDCLLRRFDGAIPFGTTRYDRDTAGFGLRVIEPDASITKSDLAGYDIVQCTADDDRNLGIPDVAEGLGAKLAGTLEYTLATRLDINAAEQGRNWPRRLVRNVRLRLRHRRRLAFLAAMTSLQANGYPAFKLCKVYDPNTLLFLDNRMTRDLYGSSSEMTARRQRLLAGAPLRLVFSGRLERLKGAHDLLPVASILKQEGVPFTLEIFGVGSLQENLAQGIRRRDLGKQVSLHAPLDFETGLVPHLRQKADVFLCCHRQADPSCTYIESMAAGLTVAGFDNEMWRALHEDSGCGALAPMGSHAALAQRVSEMHKNRERLGKDCERALEFARGHGFEALSAHRMEHLAKVAVG